MKDVAHEIRVLKCVIFSAKFAFDLNRGVYNQLFFFVIIFKIGEIVDLIFFFAMFDDAKDLSGLVHSAATISQDQHLFR